MTDTTDYAAPLHSELLELTALKILIKTASAQLGYANGDNPESVRLAARENAKLYLAAAEQKDAARLILELRTDLLNFWAEGTEEKLLLHAALNFLAYSKL